MKIFHFYEPLTCEEEATIWWRQKALRGVPPIEPVTVPDDQRVEDAGLDLDPVLDKN